MTSTTKTHRFEYHIEDLDCRSCLFYKRESKSCGREACDFENIRAEAASSGRIKRKLGHFQCRE
jgi:hypothetical protein